MCLFLKSYKHNFERFSLFKVSSCLCKLSWLYIYHWSTNSCFVVFVTQQSLYYQNFELHLHILHFYERNAQFTLNYICSNFNISNQVHIRCMQYSSRVGRPQSTDSTVPQHRTRPGLRTKGKLSACVKIWTLPCRGEILHQN